MTSLLFLGFLIGMRHALEVDHLAAVASISSRETSIRATVRHGAVWGLGHTTTLFLFGSIVLWMDTVMPEALAEGLEMAVGVMLVLLGIDVLRRVIRDRIHFHVHRHEDGQRHFHAHSHAGETGHDPDAHRHVHGPFPWRTLFIGFMHGMAGSAALILLTLQSLDSVWLGMLYMLLFGVGSIIGMAAVSSLIALPLAASARRLTWLHNGLQAAIGLFTLSLGSWILYRFSFL